MIATVSLNIGIFATTVVALLVVIFTRGQRIKELAGEVHSLRARCDDLSNQISKATFDQKASMEELTNQHDHVVKRQENEISELHKEINRLEEAERTNQSGLSS